MANYFAFSSKGLSDEQGFKEYSELYCNSSSVLRASGAFSVDVRAWKLDDILVFERRVAGVVHGRSGFEPVEEAGHFVATLVLSGRLEVSVPRGRTSIQAGAICLTDMQRAFRTEFVDAHVVTLRVARDVVEASLGGSSSLHGRVLSGPSNLLLADFFRSLARNSDMLAGSTVREPCLALIELLSGADGRGTSVSAESYRQDYRKRRTVERVIRSQLASRQLSVGAISSETGMSRSALYRLFVDHGGIARLITQRRVEAVREALEDRRSEDLATLASACGFLDERQMGRSFRDAFGVSPNAYRAQVAASSPDSPSDIRRRWQTWMPKIA